jgi:hypothetical protein
MIRTLLSLALLIAAAGLIGCIAVGGTSNQPTKGQELIDLKAALDRGAITQADYDASKTAIVNRR